MNDYYLGLDMGTNSVGWAVTDDSYHLLRAKGKDMWGMREFDAANTAAERRSHRTARRRRQREVVRHGYLRSWFDEAISEADPDFFARLDNSMYHLEDKDENVRYKYGIFNDKDFNDRDYYAAYPTIYHLRMAIINNTDHAAEDPRLVYLALANLYKRRGNFLNAGLSEDSGSTQMGDAWRSFVESVGEALEKEIDGSVSDQVTDILKDRKLSRTRKSEKIISLLQIDKKEKPTIEIIKAVTGRKFDLKKIFGEIETDEKTDGCFADASAEEFMESISGFLSEEEVSLIEHAKAVYDIGTVAEIMHGCTFLSEARISDYEKHKADLKKLKMLIARYCDRSTYDKMFRSSDPGSYSAYVGSYNSDEKHRRNMKGRTRDEFYKNVKSILSGHEDDEEVKQILSDIDTETFMPKMLTSANGVIPNQIHMREMKAILAKAENFLPFLKDKDGSGLSVSERIMALYRFRIPYYVGPTVNIDGKGNGWAVRKESGPVLPWNIDEKIDIRATKEEFINRLIRQCTYISGEKVLPKGSLLYERYQVLNEINNLCIDGERIDVGLKQDIYNELFRTGKKVTRTKLVKYLINRGCIKDDSQVTGIDKQINNALTSYGRLKPVLGEKIDTDSGKQQAEDIILICTIYGDDKSELKNTLKEKYGDTLSDKDIKRICGYKFADWGRLSKAFLTLEGADKTTGEVTNLIRALWETNLNMMELIHSERFTFAESLKEKEVKSEKHLTDFTHDDLDEYYFSAPVKRMIWQTVLIIREITHVMGKAPARVFIEMTRSDEEKGDSGRKNSRAKQLKELYKNIKDDSTDWIGLIDREDASGRLRSKKMYLYLTQMGRDMYTGEPIDLDNLFNNDLYDIDHIYPRHFVKDDSLMNNEVLVRKETNNEKQDNYPLDIKIRNNSKVSSLWRFLREKNLINEVKYARLTGSKPFSDEQKAGFIARQIVETGQATKGVADILKQLLPETKVVYSKAGNVSEFRRKYDIYKSRAVNDFHHANDAYLNIVVGNVYYTKFTDNPLNFIRNEYKKNKEEGSYNLGRMFDWDVVRNGYTAWKAAVKNGDPGTIKTVKETIKRNTPILSLMPVTVRGALSDQTIYGKDTAKEGVYLPLKGSDSRMSVEKYGGYNKFTGSYFFLVEHTVKGKRIRTLESAPLYLVYDSSDDKEILEKYCAESLRLVDPDIRMSKILMKCLVKVNGYYVFITGRQNDRLVLKNAVSLKVGPEYIRYIHHLEKYQHDGKINKELSDDENIALYNELLKKYSEGIFSLRLTPVYKAIMDGKEKFENLDLPDQCYVLLQILKLSAIGVEAADLTKIGASKSTGKMTISKKVSAYSEFKLINRSVTGLYESEVDLLTV